MASLRRLPVTAPGGGGADEIREQLAAGLRAHPGRSGFPLACGCGAVGQPYAEHVADVALLPTVRALIAAAEERGRQSVGLGDFMPDPCGDEERAPNWHFVESYGEWLPCSRRSGHDGDHEHEESGFTWPRALDGAP